jgi:hypothetical protein
MRQTRARIDTFWRRIEDAYFDYDKHTLRPDAIKALEPIPRELRDILKDYPDYKLTIEGHCDERGSAEYNMALGRNGPTPPRRIWSRWASLRRPAFDHQLRQGPPGLPGA